MRSQCVSLEQRADELLAIRLAGLSAARTRHVLASEFAHEAIHCTAAVKEMLRTRTLLLKPPKLRRQNRQDASFSKRLGVGCGKSSG